LDLFVYKFSLVPNFKIFFDGFRIKSKYRIHSGRKGRGQVETAPYVPYQYTDSIKEGYTNREECSSFKTPSQRHF